MRYIQCKDIDEATSKGENCTALMEQFKLEELAEESIVSLREAYGRIVITSGRSAEFIGGQEGSNRIGCLPDRAEFSKEVLKCLAFGHFAMACTSDIDRSDRCRTCGNKAEPKGKAP